MPRSFSNQDLELKKGRTCAEYEPEDEQVRLIYLVTSPQYGNGLLSYIPHVIYHARINWNCQTLRNGTLMTLQVNELFHSIQGESLWAGLPCSFVRLTGCNLRCRYCDTTYAYNSGQPMQIQQIVQSLAEFGCRRVTITGGEPLIQHRTVGLIQHLLARDYRVSLETNGSQDIQHLDNDCMIVMDLKCPSSGMRHQNRIENLRYLKPSDQLKFVISDREDYLFAREIVKREAHHLSGDAILFSPAFGTMPPHRLAAWILDDGIEVRLQIQLHRILWPDRDKGA